MNILKQAHNLGRLVLFATALNVASASAGEIALTFDDAPLSGSAWISGTQKTEMIIKHLKDADVPGAYFFVTTANVSSDGKHRLQQYTDAGFHLANHSHSHDSLNKRDAVDYLSDFYKSHLLLKQFDNVVKLHRFPFLHHGDSLAKRQVVHSAFAELGYEVGYVTVDNYDWYINSKARSAYEEGRSLDIDQLRKLYLDTLWNAIEFYDGIAKKSLGRSPKHVLLLHENELAALFLGDLISMLQDKGWKIISPAEAYTDPIAKIEEPEKLSFNNQGRVAAIARSQGFEFKELVSEAEDEHFLDQQIIKYGVIENPE